MCKLVVFVNLKNTTAYYKSIRKNDKRSHTYSRLIVIMAVIEHIIISILHWNLPGFYHFIRPEHYRLSKIPDKQFSQAFWGTFMKNTWNTITQHPLLYCCTISVPYWRRFQIWLLTTNEMAMNWSDSNNPQLCRTRYSQCCQNSSLSAHTQLQIVFYCCHKTFSNSFLVRNHCGWTITPEKRGFIVLAGLKYNNLFLWQNIIQVIFAITVSCVGSLWAVCTFSKGLSLLDDKVDLCLVHSENSVIYLL